MIGGGHCWDCDHNPCICSIRTQHSVKTDKLEKEIKQVVNILARVRVILANMALEQEQRGLLRPRWPINHEPLRADAKNILPEINELLRRYGYGDQEHDED